VDQNKGDSYQVKGSRCQVSGVSKIRNGVGARCRFYQPAEKLSNICYPKRSEGPLQLNFQAITEILRRLRLLRMTVLEAFPAAS
jgi:hypothetical protein